MGQFESGVWIVGLLFYFTGLFVLVYCVAAGIPDADVSYADPGYGASHTPSTVIVDIDPTTTDVGTDTPGMGSVMTTLSILTSVGSGSYDVGIPSGWAWLFSFVFFYIPLFMLLWAVYMAIPIIH